MRQNKNTSARSKRYSTVVLDCTRRANVRICRLGSAPEFYSFLCKNFKYPKVYSFFIWIGIFNPPWSEIKSSGVRIQKLNIVQRMKIVLTVVCFHSQ